MGDAAQSVGGCISDGRIGIGAFLVEDREFMLTFFMLFIALGFYTMSLKCPSCKKPVLNNPIHIFGVELWLTTPWMPKKCSKCGYDLGK